jgi:cytochrome c553
MTPIRALALRTVFCGLLSCSAAAFAEDQAPAPAGPDLAKGGAIAMQVCAACHAPDGNATTNQFPKLAGQHAGYIVKQLANFKTGERANAIMGPYAAALSDDDMRNVAAYFAKQTVKPSSAHSAELAALGQKIYRGGISERGVPACAACHGPSGAGIPVQYPRVAGQWEEYAQAQLTAFKSGARNNNVPMSTIAQRLSEDEIKAVSDYIAGLR